MRIWIILTLSYDPHDINCSEYGWVISLCDHFVLFSRIMGQLGNAHCKNYEEISTGWGHDFFTLRKGEVKVFRI